MKLATIIGTRPEIIRLSRIIPALNDACQHTVIHTGQNYDPTLGSNFFTELELPPPDIQLDCKAKTPIGQLMKMFGGVETAINEIRPDRVLILGDTNTSLCAVIVERMGIPVYHMEAGNRCFDMRVPEEKNRHVIDSVSSYNLPYTPGSRENLLREGIAKNKIFECGNPINEVMTYYSKSIEKSTIITDMKLSKACWCMESSRYVLVTAHREENVDNPVRLKSIVDAMTLLSDEFRVIFSCHPRTAKRLTEFGITLPDGIIMHEPFGFFDFVKLEKHAVCAVTDSGTVQEECCILRTPTVTIRDSTERPETVECGSNIVTGVDPTRIVECVHTMQRGTNDWSTPVGYDATNVSKRVVNYLIGYQML